MITQFFFVLLAVLGVVTLVGHGIWVLLAWLFRGINPTPSERAQPPRHAVPRQKERCARCDAPILADQERCLACGLDPASATAGELRDLEITARQLAAFHEAGSVDFPTFERLRQCINERRRALQTTARVPALQPDARVPALQPDLEKTPEPALDVIPVDEPHPPLWQELERLLESCEDIRNLAIGRRHNALDLHRQLSEAELGGMSAKAQLALARLLKVSSKSGDALGAYRRLLDRHPEDATAGEAALEAGRLAVDQKLNDQGRWFIEQALAKSLSPASRQEAERLLASLRAPVVEKARSPLPSPAPAPVRPIKPPPPPRPPRRSIAEVLAAFMEERNILWGELIGGLLMVGCSIALVISLWKTLEAIPYFPFLIFAAITAAIFGAGLYTLHHWKLESTSRGLLMIATLLVPLNFLVMAGLSIHEGESAPVPIAFRIGTEAIALGVFGVLLSGSARVLVPEGRWLTMLGVLGASASQLAVPRLLAHTETNFWPFFLVSALPTACYGLSAGGVLLKLSGLQPFDEGRAIRLFVFLGLTVFPLVVALGLLVYWSGDVAIALERLSLIVSIAGIPLLIGGLLVHRGLPEATPSAPTGDVTSARSSSLRTAGTALALAGMLVMVGAVILAWPQPIAILLVCALNFAVLTTVAFRYGLPVAHAPALLCLAVGYLAGFHLVWGNLAVPQEQLGMHLLRMATSAQSGSALVLVVLGLAAAAEILVRTGQRPHALFYACGSGLVALASLALVNLRGVTDPGSATVVTSIYAVGSLLMNLRWRRPLVSYIGLALAIVATLWALWGSEHVVTPLWGTTLAFEALLMAGLALVAARLAFTPAAWRDMAAAGAALALGLALWSLDGSPSLLQSSTGSILAATVFLLAWIYQARLLTWVGSGMILLTLLHALLCNMTRLPVPHPSLAALLVHMSFVLLSSLALTRVRRLSLPALHEATETSSDWSQKIQIIFAKPLYDSALVCSLATLPVLFVLAWGEMIPAAVYLGWLSIIWLVIAIESEQPGFFSAFQAGLTESLLFGVTAWLETRGWQILSYPLSMADPIILYTYGIALGVLSFLWMALRVWLLDHARAQRLLNSRWPSVDWAVLNSLVVGQLALAVMSILPGVLNELTPAGINLHIGGSIYTHADVNVYKAWLFVILAAVLALALYERRLRDTVRCWVFLLVAAPVLLAARFSNDLAAASALRWNLAICFVIFSIPLWLRDYWTPWPGISGPATDPAQSESSRPPALRRLTRRLLVACLVVPVVALTATVALIGFSGQTPAGPRSSSFFAQIGWVASNITPLAVLSLGLVGHALRERSPGYAFFAGLLVNCAVTGGYALGIVTSGHALGEAEWVQLVQLGTMAAAVWTLAWLASRAWVEAWQERADSPLAKPLMSVQVGMAAVGSNFFILVALGLLVILFPAQTRWTAEAGSLLGWLAFVSTAAAVTWLQAQRSRVQSHTIGLLGMAAAGLLACTVAGWRPAWAYRALMLSWACYTPLLVLAGWISEWRKQQVAAPDAEKADSVIAWAVLPPQAVEFWVRAAGILVVLLGLKAAIMHEDHLWAAGAIAIASAAGAAMAVWRRREDWAFTAGLGINLAASLTVWHYYRFEPVADWWVYLLQANLIAGAVVGLLWLGTRRLFYGPRELGLRTAPLLATQVTLLLCGNSVLLLWPLLRMVVLPGTPLPVDLVPVGQVGGWLGLLLGTAATFWYAGQVAPERRADVLIVFGLSLGVLAACSASQRADAGDWLAYHMLTAAWAGTGLVVLGAERIAQIRNREIAEFSSLPFLAQYLRLSTEQLRRWLNIIGLLVLTLACRGIGEDPARPYWSAGATLAVSAMAGAIAIKSRSPLYVYISGLLVNLAGSIVWVAWGTDANFAYTQVLCFGLSSVAWSVLELLQRTRVPPSEPQGRSLPFTHVAGLLGLCSLGVVVALAVASDLTAGGAGEIGLFPWTACAAVALAFILLLWDRDARFAVAGLYALGVLAIGLALHTGHFEPRMLAWNAALVLAAYVLLTAALGWLLPVLAPLWRELRLPERRVPWPDTWFAPVQVLLSCTALALSVWISLTFDTTAERLGGPGTVMVLMAAGMLLIQYIPGRWQIDLRYAVLALGVFVLAEGGWACLDPTVSSPWLYRNVLLMLALALLSLGYGVLLVKVLPRPGGWADAVRSMGPVLGSLAALMLLVVLGHEGLLYDPSTGRTSMEPAAVGAVAATLVGLIAAAIAFAVIPSRDPFRLSERGRMAYVYAAEVLLALLFVHFWLTVPELFRGFLAPYWTFIVMAIAFVDVGVSEFFARRGMRVLSEPLQRTGIFLPLVPLLAYWVRPLDLYRESAIHQVFGFDSLLQHATLWFLLGLLYTLVAVSRRSFRYALLAALAANAGLWALLYHNQLHILVHPQLWLIPIALILLVAEHLNRERLSEVQSNALRYAALLVVYVSSTADMFIAGLGHSLVLPLVLAVLSVVGVLAGILLRVRAFLYLGVSFLFLVVLSMIWHAAVDRHQMWVWWVSGIVLGAAIIALFAVFEKRRNDVLRMIEQIKKWD
jgi:hypothetical protein